MKPASPATMTATLTLAVLTAVVLTGCSSPRSDASAPQRSTRAPGPTPSLNVRAAAERDALAAYRGMWRAFVHAASTSNANDPLLTKYATSDALHTIQSALTKDRRQHRVAKGRVSTHPIVLSARPGTRPSQITLRDCADDSHWLTYHENGGLVDDQPGGKHSVTAIVEDRHGWKVTAFAAHEVGTCT
ncbi:hypothetical protein NUM_43260 [Actinocatenispora comari]|uniref:Secreted protein/lipoprotein n=2 Tax=Actinocatenispora comari TaxID=2807577 RepID=A0A8J4AH06_9ACTN|nr:hypothetical protein NUM_43260 [Actinocatenispora comari]